MYLRDYTIFRIFRGSKSNVPLHSDFFQHIMTIESHKMFRFSGLIYVIHNQCTLSGNCLRGVHEFKLNVQIFKRKWTVLFLFLIGFLIAQSSV